VAAWFLWLLIHIVMHVTDYISSLQLSNSPAVKEIIKKLNTNFIRNSNLYHTVTRALSAVVLSQLTVR